MPAFRFIGSFVALNLFVGVIVDKFNQIKKDEEGSATMTNEQRQWVQSGSVVGALKRF